MLGRGRFAFGEHRGRWGYSRDDADGSMGGPARKKLRVCVLIWPGEVADGLCLAFCLVDRLLFWRATQLDESKRKHARFFASLDCPRAREALSSTPRGSRHVLPALRFILAGLVLSSGASN